MEEIEKELDQRGLYIHIYKQDGYKAYALIFEKENGDYSVCEHLSTENGYEEEIGDTYCESINFNDLVEYLKGKTNYFGEPFINEKGELL